MKNFILWGGLFLLTSFPPCFAQEKETATYSIYPYIETASESREWNITLPEQPETSVESFVEGVIKNTATTSLLSLIIDHAGKTCYYERAGEELNFQGYKEAWVMHPFETPILHLTDVWEQNFSGTQLTLFGKRHYDLRSTPMGKGILSIGADKTEVSLVKTSEEITETSLKPYRKVRVCHYFLEDNGTLPLFQTVTDTLYTNEGKEKRVISFALYRKQHATGTGSNPEQGNLQVYPNPTNGEFVIDNPDTEPSIVGIYDFTGKLQQSVHLKQGHNEVSISHLPLGAYVLKHLSQTTCTGIKLIKL